MARYRTIAVGNAELVALQDSWTTRDPGGFFLGVEASAWEPYRSWLNPDGLLAHNFGCFLVRSRGKNILVDTGLGQWPNPLDLAQSPMLLDALGQAGTPRELIDLVLFTHLHWDHTGWNTIGPDGAIEPTFPNARYVVQRREFEYWSSPGDKPPAGADFGKVLAPVIAAGLLDVVDEEYEATSEVIAVPTPGHTPGHVSFGIESDGVHAYILGDAAHKPVQLSEPHWYPGFDMDPVESTRSRTMILDRAERENAILAGGHFEFPSMGYPTRVNGQRSFAYVTGGVDQPWKAAGDL